MERRGEGVDRRAARQEPLAGAVAGRSRNDGSSPSARVDAVEYDGYPPSLSLEEETWRQVALGAGSAAPNTGGEASDGEKSDGEAGDALPLSATDVGGAVATGGEGSGVERGGGSSRDGQRRHVCRTLGTVPHAPVRLTPLTADSDRVGGARAGRGREERVERPQERAPARR